MTEFSYFIIPLTILMFFPQRDSVVAAISNLTFAPGDRAKMMILIG